jgi:hypothetical protein
LFSTKDGWRCRAVASFLRAISFEDKLLRLDTTIKRRTGMGAATWPLCVCSKSATLPAFSPEKNALDWIFVVDVKTACTANYAPAA